jgi:hypothetical protein
MVLEWHSGMDWVASSLLARVKLLARWKITPHKNNTKYKLAVSKSYQ